MNLLGPTFVLYLVVGIAVAAAVYLHDPMGKTLDVCFRLATALLFWPLYLPILLGASREGKNETSPDKPQAAPTDEMAAAIAQVEAELEAALGSLDGWAEGVLSREKDRLHELRNAWTHQATRIREMDRLLSLPEQEFAPTSLGPDKSGAGTDRLHHSGLVRRQNMERLGRIRQRAYEDLMGTLAWVRELVSMIHLAKFTGAPASRAEELVAQVAAAVEGLSEFTWQDDPRVDAGDNTSIRV